MRGALATAALLAAALGAGATQSACGGDGPAGGASSRAAASGSPPVGAPVGASGPGAPGGPGPSGPGAVAVPGAASPREVEDELSTQPLELLRFRFTSAVEDREPVDELSAAKPGQRVYAHLALRNRTGRRKHVTLRFSVNGEQRTELELPVDESWQFRTWGYNTLLPKDRSGTLRLEVTDESGHPVLERDLPIRP